MVGIYRNTFQTKPGLFLRLGLGLDQIHTIWVSKFVV